MALFWLAFLALVVFAVVRLFPPAAPTRGPFPDSGHELRTVLDRRLASGEIDVEQYEQLKAKLDAPSRPAG
jgi:putative membrane protein